MQLTISVTVDAPTPEEARAIIEAAFSGAAGVVEWECYDGSCVDRCPGCGEKVEHGFDDGES